MKPNFRNLALIIGLSLTTLSACEQQLELFPENGVGIEATFTTPTGAESALFGTYSGFAGAAYSYSVISTELQTANVNFAGSFTTLQEIRDGVFIDDNGTFTTFWQGFYATNNRANLFLENLAILAGLDDDTRTQWNAEARFIRAVMHFELLKHFGDRALTGPSSDGNAGIPIITTGFIEDFETSQAKAPRATNGEVWDFIESELTDIAGDLPEAYGSAEEDAGRATRGAALAFLARVALYRQDYTTAASRALEVINLGEYALFPVGSFAAANFRSANDEQIFQMQATSIVNPGVNNAVPSFYRPNPGRGDMRIDGTDFQTIYGTGDQRGTLISGTAPAFTTKWADAVTLTDDIPLIRYADVLLIRAEALARLNGVDATAISLYNEVRAARITGYTNAVAGDFANGTALVNEILAERQREFYCEGHQKYDLLRTGRALRNIAVGNFRETYPVPRRERDQNPNLTQNPGY